MKENFGWDYWQEMLGLIAFVSCVCTIFCWSGLILTRLIADRVKQRREHRLRIRERCALVLAGIGVLCVLYGYFVEPYWLSVESVRLTSDKIQSGQMVRIVQISDLHCDPRPRLEEKLPEVISAQKPDIIVFTGDAINSPAGLPIFRKCLTQIAKIAPTFAVKGNWDAWWFRDLDRFAKTGAIELMGKPAKLQVRESEIWLSGLPIGTRSTISEAVRGIPANGYSVFLFHYPDFIEEMARNKVDLYLAGHTHGGQVALPVYGAIITLSSRGKRYESGLHNLGATHLYVNRGIGMEGGLAPRVRFCARPEVTVIDIVGTSTEERP